VAIKLKAKLVITRNKSTTQAYNQSSRNSIVVVEQIFVLEFSLTAKLAAKPIVKKVYLNANKPKKELAPENC
jgi:hypothetical protein